jgi:hypothetical protein
VKRTYFNIVKLITLLIFSLNSQINAQLPLFHNPQATHIKKHVNEIENTLDEKYTLDYFTLDSTKIFTKRWHNKIETVNVFEKNNDSLIISFYFDKEKLIMIQVTEESTRLRNLAKKFTEFYFKNGKSFLTNDYYLRPTGIALKPGEEDDFYGYNKMFTDQFLFNYSHDLLNKILIGNK